jgi:hypothetical protein
VLQKNQSEQTLGHKKNSRSSSTAYENQKLDVHQNMLIKAGSRESLGVPSKRTKSSKSTNRV